MIDPRGLRSASRNKFCVRGRLSAQILLAAVAAAQALHPEKLPHPELHCVRFPIYEFCSGCRHQSPWCCLKKNEKKNSWVFSSCSSFSRSFTATAIQHCFATDLHNYSADFYLNYYARVGATAAASVLIWLSATRYGRRGLLLFSAIATCLPSLLLLAFNQSESTALLLSCDYL